MALINSIAQNLLCCALYIYFFTPEQFFSFHSVYFSSSWFASLASKLFSDISLSVSKTSVPQRRAKYFVQWIAKMRNEPRITQSIIYKLRFLNWFSFYYGNRWVTKLPTSLALATEIWNPILHRYHNCI